jgi:acetoin utilization deacetylase AcuC-like enzyme
MRVVHSPAHAGHAPGHEVLIGRATAPIEVPARAAAIRAVLAADAAFTIEEPVPHGLTPIECVHDHGLIAYLARAHDDWLAAAPDVGDAIPDSFLNPALREGMGPGRPPETALGRLGWYGFDTATVVVAGTYTAARAAVDVALTAADHVLGGEPCAYGLCRPPGHHAPRAAYGGYCFFNNAAVAAEHALAAGAGPVAIVDIDYHHGNGTQQIFYGRADVLYVSLHADPRRAYPFFAGHPDETGAGAGAGANRNFVLPPACDDITFLATLHHALEVVDAFDPAIVVVSLGLDTFHLDPLGDLAVTEAAYPEAGRAVAALGRPLVVLQEGGYHLPTLGANVHAWLRAAAGV